jgi:hypothetical protein
MACPFPPACPGTYGPGPLIVDAPNVPLWEYGLLSVATVLDGGDVHQRNGIAYKSFACVGTVNGWTDDCTEPPLKYPTDTLSGEDNIVQGCPFHIYAALSCKTTTLEDMARDVAEVYRLGEQKQVENQVWNNVLATSNATLLNTDETTANAYTVVGTIAALESAIASCYGGRATIHADRGLMAYLIRDRQVVLVDGDHYETPLGTKVAFYGGSPNSSREGVSAAAGYAWLYVTPELTIRRFPIDILPPDAAHRLSYGVSMTNEPYIVAERTYVPSTECCIFVAQACLSC